MSDPRARIEEDSAPGSREPRCSLEHAEKAREHYCGTVRAPSEPDEQGAVNVVELLFAGPGKRDRVAFFQVEGTKQCRVLFLDRASQPRVHAPGEDHPAPAPVRQSVAPRTSQPPDALPLFGSPGCAAPDCARPPETVQRVAEPAAMPPKLVCSCCGAKPKPDTLALEGGPHRIVHTRRDASRPRQDFLRTAICGKWRRA